MRIFTKPLARHRGSASGAAATSRRRLLPALLAILFALLAAPAAAQDASAPAKAEPVKAGIHISPPFVMRDGDGYAGMAIDIARIAAQTLDVDYEIVPFDRVRALMDATAAGDVDVAITNLAITKARAERVDFTQPWYDSGLRIMVNEDRGVSFGDVVGGLADAGFLRAYAWLALVIIAATVILTLFDRRFNKGFPARWREGIAESFYTVMSVATSGRMPSRPNLFGWTGRICQAFWLICGIAVLAYVTSSVTSVMTALTLTNDIRNFADLHDRHVGVEDGSIAEEVVTEEGIGRTEYGDMDALVAALLADEVDAIVGDAPVLEYYAITHPGLPLDVVGPIFNPDKYGFAFPKDSTLADRMTVEVLGALERDDIEAIRVRYFGDDP